MPTLNLLTHKQRLNNWTIWQELASLFRNFSTPAGTRRATRQRMSGVICSTEGFPLAGIALDDDPQVDFVGQKMLDLLRAVKSQGLDGRFAIEFSAHHGDIRSARTQREQPLPQLPPAKK